MKEYTEEQSREAAEWFLIVHDSQDPPAELLQEWGRWLASSKSHRAAFEAVENAYHLTAPSLVAPLTFVSDTKQAATSREALDDYDGSISVAEWLQRQAQRTHPRETPWRWIGPVAALAASVMAIVVLPHWTEQPRSLIETSSSGTFSTQTAQHKELLLPDGSRITLGARSALSLDLGAHTRTIHLERGEAFFSVHKDPARPFVVHALDGVITAVGTAFNVRALGGQVSVAVREGVVRVAFEESSNGESADSAVRLSVGELLSFNPRVEPLTPSNAAITHFDTDDVARWREGWLVYRNEPLRVVVADVARYTNLDLGVADTLGSDLRFSGMIFKDSVDEWITALPRAFPVIVENSGSRRTIVPRAPPVTAER